MNENVAREVILPTGLVDNKVCAIDDVWSGLRFVVRLANRPARPVAETARAARIRRRLRVCFARHAFSVSRRRSRPSRSSRFRAASNGSRRATRRDAEAPAAVHQRGRRARSPPPGRAQRSPEVLHRLAGRRAVVLRGIAPPPARQPRPPRGERHPRSEAEPAEPPERLAARCREARPTNAFASADAAGARRRVAPRRDADGPAPQPRRALRRRACRGRRRDDPSRSRR